MTQATPSVGSSSSSFWTTTREFLFDGRRRRPAGVIPFQALDASAIEEPGAPLEVRWLGHSSAYINMEGVRILTDPMFGRRASPVPFAGPSRFHPPPASLEILAAGVDVVLISHDHYDHLDKGTMKQMARWDVRFVVPTGVGAHLIRWGVPAARITELGWWEETAIKRRGSTVRLVCTPSRHFSGRSLSDRNKTLWASYAILGAKRRAFFSGDTGPTDVHQEIGERLGPFDLTMIEVGAHHPSWGDVHLGPDKAMAAHQMLGGEVMLPIHWATFDLALHAWDDPIETLAAKASGHGIVLATPRIGEALVPGAGVGSPLWWRALN